MTHPRGSLPGLGATLALAVLLAGCFSSSSAGPSDAGSFDVTFEDDSATDGTVDATTDAGVEGAVDAASASDAGVDSAGASDVGVEGSPDSSLEAAADASPDAPAEAAAPGVYVDPVNGLDTNPGTQALPFKTLYHATIALNAEGDAGAGQTVYLADGTYDSTSQTNFWGTFNQTTFVRGSAPGKAILVGNYSGETLYFAAGGGIANVTFKNVYQSFAVQHGTFTASGVGFDGLPGPNGASVSFLNDSVSTVDTLTVTNMNTAGGQDLATLLYADQTASVTWHAAGTAITSPASSPGNAIFARAGGKIAIDGLTLTNYPGFAAVLYDQAQLTLTNSTITGSGPAPGICSAAGCRASIWLGGSQSGVPTTSLTLVGTTISGSPGSAVGYSTAGNTGAGNLTFTSSHLDNNAFAGLWIGGPTNAALNLTLTATGTTFNGNAMSGVTAAPRTAISLTGGSVSNNGSGAGALSQTPGGVVMLDAASANSLTMRSVTLAGNTGSFVNVAGSASTTVDLGTAASLGGNTFSGVAAGVGASALNLSALVNATAVGNTWMPNVQGASAAGLYTAATTITGPATGLNVIVPSGASVVMQ